MTPRYSPVFLETARNTAIVAALLSVFLLLVFPVSAREKLPDRVAEEIHHLLDYVEKSGCEFYRNGRWYQGTEARRHLQMKYEYLRDRGHITKAEEFIDLGASKSSISGNPYKVRCGDRPAIQTGPWFRNELNRFRKSSGGGR